MQIQPLNNEPVIFKPTPKQREAKRLLLTNRQLLYGGAIRGAKSHFGCMAIISLCQQYPNSRWVMLRKDSVVLKATLLKTFKENFIDKGWSQEIDQFNQTDLVLTWKNKSQILFMGENFDRDKDLNRFKGLEFNGAFIDEVNEVQELTLDKIIERAGSWFHSPNCPTKIIMSCNPTQNWVKRRFYDKFKAGTLPPGVAYLQAKIFDNPYIPQDYLDSLKLLPIHQYRVFVDGEWDVAMKVGNEFLRMLDTDIHVRANNWDITNLIHVSMDSNVYPYIAVTIWQIEKDGLGYKIKQVNELPAVDPINTATKAGKNLGEWLNKIGYTMRVLQYGDKSTKNRNNIDDNKKSFYDLFTEAIAKEGFRIEDKMLKAAPPVAGIADFVNAILAGEVPGLSIEIGENCKESINDYIETKTDKDGTMLKKRITDPKTGISYEPHGHLTDTLKDFIVSAFHTEYLAFINKKKGLGVRALSI
ncbi:MAG: hypothetical protein EOO85_14225 [Pedobacter sp.]|nr:MAG: hypothetical protein EOO85_14225 [Pedobacter sp.]